MSQENCLFLQSGISLEWNEKPTKQRAAYAFDAYQATGEETQTKTSTKKTDRQTTAKKPTDKRRRRRRRVFFWRKKSRTAFGVRWGTQNWILNIFVICLQHTVDLSISAKKVILKSYFKIKFSKVFLCIDDTLVCSDFWKTSKNILNLQKKRKTFQLLKMVDPNRRKKFFIITVSIWYSPFAIRLEPH